jgi:hypothetical protein
MKKNKKSKKSHLLPVSLREEKIVEVAFKAGQEEQARLFKAALTNGKIIADVLFPENHENDF